MPPRDVRGGASLRLRYSCCDVIASPCGMARGWLYAISCELLRHGTVCHCELRREVCDVIRQCCKLLSNCKKSYQGYIYIYTYGLLQAWWGHYASPTSGKAYRDRRLTTNFELWVEIFCVSTCFHVRIPKPCLSVCLSVRPSVCLSAPREKKSS